MSDTEQSAAATPAKASNWTDKERLVYLFALIEQTGTKPDFKNTPRPANRTEIACQRMVERLKSTIKTELDALKAGSYVDEPTAINADGGEGFTTPKKLRATPKRKTPAAKKGEDGAECENGEEGSPKKKAKGGWKKKCEVVKEEPVKEVEVPEDGGVEI